MEKNIKDIYNFLIKYLNNNNIIMEVSNDYYDDKCLIEEYDIFERKYNKGDNKFNYIYNDEYRSQLALISIEKKDFDLIFFIWIIIKTIRIMEKKSPQKLWYMRFCGERFP